MKKLRHILRREIEALARLRQIDEARVSVTREDETSPPFRVRAHLVTPGPDVFAEARDHTVAAALAKVKKQLSAAIRFRAGRRLGRLKGKLGVRHLLGRSSARSMTV